MDIAIHKVEKIKLETKLYKGNGHIPTFTTYRIIVTDKEGVKYTTTLYANDPIVIEGVFNDD